MPQHELEVILMRHLASCLAMPIFVVDPTGNLVFYNESAETILGRRFEETGEMPSEEWATAFTPTDEHDTPIPGSDLPLMLALTERHPAHRRMWIRGLDGVRRHLDVTAFPLIGQAERFVGAVAVFWEIAP